MAASPRLQPWSFDVSSLMVLVSEGEEESYRLSQRSWLQCLVLSPVVGLQNYVRSYDFLLDAAKMNYFSPYGVKTAPLRYMRLSNALRYRKVLEDASYYVYRIPNKLAPRSASSARAARKIKAILVLWVLFTWIVFGGVLTFTIIGPNTTWVGVTNCLAFTSWSVILRLVERVNISLAKINDSKIALPDEEDAVFILGRSNSGFVLEGTRRDVKHWTARGLKYKRSTLGIPGWLWQSFTRLGSLMMILFIFSSIPNGSTMDQLAFIIMNGLAQINVIVGQMLNSASCLSELETTAVANPATRTEVYGLLTRRFKHLEEEKGWIEASGMLPQTTAWKEWKREVLKDDGRDPDQIYEQIVDGSPRRKDTSSTSGTRVNSIGYVGEKF